MKDRSDDPSHHERTSKGKGVRCRSLVEQAIGCQIKLSVDLLSYLLFQPVLDDWFNKGHGMSYPVCGMVHTKDLLLIRKTSCFNQCSMTGLTKAMVCAILSVEWCIQKICCQSEKLVIVSTSAP